MLRLVLLLVLGCPGESDTADTADTATDLPAWQDVGENLPGALLSVWGSGADDVFVVGADAGSGPMAFHLSGGVWTPLSGLDAGDLWWVSGDATGVWMAGVGGRVFHGEADGSGLIGAVTDPTVTLYGIWGPGDGTAWAVGGNPDVPADAARVFHYDGTAWTDAAIPVEAAAQFALYKVWGAAADDVWAVGANGIAIHWDGSAWTNVETLSLVNLFTVHDGYAVGGTVGGTILRSEGGGTTWTDESPDFALQITGVHGGADPVAVGSQGSVWLRENGAWTPDPRSKPTYQDLHAVWRDPDGGVWSVGGHISSLPLIQGALVYAGYTIIPLVEN